ncbi:MAG: polyhydroxyalkanoate synthesis regulator DNA-binding domain-containing protein [Anaerolineales bacterium]|nr:polyhydroxyalkanoate synthesis regulator DNA-binding domain-containing protein [Anaerolineales bacterium]
MIKRYPNRKLYSTETKQYIKLEEIAALIRQGEEIQVTDHVSGADITALTLTQIILEQEKKKTGLLTISVLIGLIRFSGVGLLALQQQIPTRADIQRLNHQLEELAAKIEEISR